MKKKKTWAALVLVIMLALLGTTSGWAQTGLTYFVSNVDASGFPLVQFNLRAVDLSNHVQSGLNANDLTVYENGQQASDLKVTPNEKGPVTYVIVIDQGRLSNYSQFGINNMKQAISLLVSGGFFQDGDTVMVLGRQNDNSDQTVTLRDKTQSGSDLTSWVASFGFPRSTGGNTKGLLGVDDALTQMQQLVPETGSQTTVILFFTRYIEDPSDVVATTNAQNLAAKAKSNDTMIYVFQTDFSGFRSQSLQVLAEGTGGLYTHLDRNTVQSQMTTAYQSIDAQRTIYAVSYRSAISDEGRREITINSPTRSADGVSGSYEVSPQPPVVKITSPANNTTIQRTASSDNSGGTPAFDLTNTKVTAEVSWPDGLPRAITTAQFYVNGKLEDTAQVSPNQTSFDFNWDMSDLNTAGSNPVALRVSVKDELGLTAEGDATVNVDVSAPPTPSGGLLSSPGRVAAIGLPVLCLLVLIVVAIIVGAYFVFRSRSSSSPQIGGQPEAEAQKTLFVTDVPGGLALATLTVLEGPSGMIGEQLRITTLNVAIGRDPSQTDISFYADTESSVSRLHCTIRLDDDNAFRLTDKNSSAGTRLNGRHIQPESPVVLADGDEIVLGDLAQKGVKLQFNFATTEENRSPYSGTADDRTHLLGDSEDWGAS